MISLCVDVEIIVAAITTVDGITTITVVGTTTVDLIITITAVAEDVADVIITIIVVATIIITTIVTAIENVADATGMTTVDVVEKDMTGMTTVDVVEKDATEMTTVDVVEKDMTGTTTVNVVEKDATGMTTVIGTEITKIEIMHTMSGAENVKNINDHMYAVVFATNIQSYLQRKRTCTLFASPFSLIRITYFNFIIHNIYTL